MPNQTLTQAHLNREAKEPLSAPLLSEQFFQRALHLEQKRAERSNNSFILMRVDCSIVLKSCGRGMVEKIANLLISVIRETDIAGWADQSTSPAVIFTELGTMAAPAAVEHLAVKISKAIIERFGQELASQIRVCFEIFPDADGRNASALCLDFVTHPGNGSPKPNRLNLGKRLLDTTSSLGAIVLFSPVLLGIAILVKLTSKGPIIFRQERVGLNGRPFQFFKFRSMYVANDNSVHQRYVEQLIAGEIDGKSGQGFKMKNDPRVTPIGRFLRRTSLDELPQFFNVLTGDMSVVGPRPPIAYEVAKYCPWHMRRLQIKPGITGLWQVKGRSRTTFDEMVRMDLHYARTWSLWHDLKLVLQTPRAMFFGEGAH